MKLEKAQVVLGDIITYQYSSRRSDEGDAIKLGLQALNVVAWIREGHILPSEFRLPGETNE